MPPIRNDEEEKKGDIQMDSSDGENHYIASTQSRSDGPNIIGNIHEIDH